MILPAPFGTEVKLYYDSETPVAEGDYLRTGTGRLYEVLDVRVQQRGKHVGRQHLVCLVARGAPPDATIHPVHWYPRKASR